MRQKKILRIAVFFLFFIFLAFAWDASVVTPPRTQNMLPPSPKLAPSLQGLLYDYDHFFTDSMRLTGTPGAAVVVVKDSAIIFAKGYGLRKAGEKDSVDINTVFRIGSLSKGFAGVLAGLLVRDGAIHWDDPVKKHYSPFALSSAEQTRRITLKHLLSHSTGLPYHTYTNLIEAGYDIPYIAGHFKNLPLNGKEGTVFSYQNAAFSVIEEVMRTATGKSYQELLCNRIFAPADMKNASVTYEAIQKNENKALPHQWSGYNWIPGDISPTYYNSAAAGGVNASALDMGKWLLLLMGQRESIASTQTLEPVFQPFIKTYNERRHFRQWPGRREAHYAMGWRVLTWAGDTIVCHGGYVNGYKSEIAFNRKDRIGICVLFNAHSDLSAHCLPAFFERYFKKRREITEGL